MSLPIALLDLGTAIADILVFLAPADQHKLRRTSSAMCEWFDSAAENGSLAFFVTFASDSSAGPLRWKHVTSKPRDQPEQEEPDAANGTSKPLATVTVHARNYYLSSFNAQARGEAAVADDGALIECATIRLVAGFPFEHKLVVTGLFGIRSIGDDFCRGVNAKAIEFKTEGNQLESVGDYWLSNCTSLERVTFTGFTALEEVGNYWMSDCLSLENITFAGDLPKLKKVGEHWMSDCEKLRHVDLSGFPALQEVCGGWLTRCFSLESITFASSMSKLKKVGEWWMSNCSALRHVDLSGFAALEEVGGGWISSCESLENVTFAGDMPNLKMIGAGWLTNCEKLKHVHLAGFTALEEVGDSWLSGCLSLESVTFAADMSNLKKVGHYWLYNCKKLRHIDLSGFAALEEVGDYWMFNCSDIESITLAGNMSNLKKVGDDTLPKLKKLLSI